MPSPLNVLVVACALRSGSKTAAIARALAEQLQRGGAEAEVLDLATTPLPQCDGASCYQDAGVKAATEKVRAAHAVALCFPVYNFQANAAAKNFVELTNEAWKRKVVGLVANAGAERSYMAPLSLANALLVDYRCLIAPRLVYVTGACFAADGMLPAEGDAVRRLRELTVELIHLGRTWPPA